MAITALYAGPLALLFVFLSIRVIQARRINRVALGDGGNAELMRRIRVHANLAEYAPLALLLLALLESLKTPGWLVHLLGLALVTARFVHAYGVSQSPEKLALRVFGMATTFTVIGVAALSCLVRGAGLVFGG